MGVRVRNSRPRSVPSSNPAFRSVRKTPGAIAFTQTPDLAHSMAVEFEGVPGLFRAGSVVISDRGSSTDRGTRRFPIGPILGRRQDSDKEEMGGSGRCGQ